MECEEADCEREAAFELHIPWKENEFVCPGHARTKSRKDGIVADAIEESEDEFPAGAANR